LTTKRCATQPQSHCRGNISPASQVETAVSAEQQQLPAVKQVYDDALKSCVSAYDAKRTTPSAEAADSSLLKAVAGDFFC
jgi:hypothetical protein